MTDTSTTGVTPPTRAYRGVPAEERVAQRRSLLLAAGLELFGTRGIAATRVDDLCAEAGLTKRYFYESFASLDELIEAVVDDAVTTLAGAVVPAVETGGWRNPRPALEAFVTGILADPRLVRLLVVETHAGALTGKRQALIELAVDLWLQADPANDHDPRNLPGQRFRAHAMGGAVLEVCLAWASGRIAMTPEELVDHVVHLFERAMPEGPGGSQPSSAG